MSETVLFDACWRNVTIYALLRMLAKCWDYLLWRILVKCRDLRALTHVGKLSWFTHFARHKISAARHFQLFCTPAKEGQLSSVGAGRNKEVTRDMQTMLTSGTLSLTCQSRQVFYLIVLSFFQGQHWWPLMLKVKWLVNWSWKYMYGEVILLGHPLFKILCQGCKLKNPWSKWVWWESLRYKDVAWSRFWHLGSSHVLWPPTFLSAFPTVDRLLDLGFLSVSSAWQGKGVATMLASKAEHLARWSIYDCAFRSNEEVNLLFI